MTEIHWLEGNTSSAPLPVSFHTLPLEVGETQISTLSQQVKITKNCTEHSAATVSRKKILGLKVSITSIILVDLNGIYCVYLSVEHGLY